MKPWNFLNNAVGLSTVLAFVLTSIAIPANAQDHQDKAQEPIRLRLWQGFKREEVTLLRQAMASFSEDWSRRNGRQLILSEEQVPFDDMSTRLRMAAPGGARLMPDMAMVDANKIAELVYGGVVVDLTQLKGMPAGGIETARKEYSEGALETNILYWKGEERLFGLPAQTTTLALYWNKDMFTSKTKELIEANLDPNRPPRDWDELIAYSRALRDESQGHWGFAFNNSLWFTMPFINQYQGTFAKVDEKGKWVATPNDPGLLAALNRKMNMYLVDRIEAGAWQDSATNPDQGFLQQIYAMILTGPWNIEDFRRNRLNFGVALIPRVPLKEAIELGLVSPDTTPDSPEAAKLSSSSIGGQNIVLLNTCQHPEIAFEFMRYFTGERVQRQWAEELGQIPTYLPAQKDLVLKNFPEVKVFMEQVNLARPWPRLPRSGKIETDMMNPNMNLVLQGRITVEEAMRRVGNELTLRILNPVNEAFANTPD
jgi:multiple sugar transport system substrate-binding protein